MSFFDMAKSAAAGYLGAQGGSSPLLAIAMALLEKNGGVSGVIEKFQGAGLGGLVQSWLGQGANLPISAEQLTRVFGHPQIQGLAQQFGFDTNELSRSLASFLPTFLDKLSPDGQPPGAGIDAGKLFELGKSFFAKQ